MLAYVLLSYPHVMITPFSTSLRSSSGKGALVLAGLVALSSVLRAGMYDLSLPGTQTYDVLGDVGGTAIISDFWSQPTGTGVFDPFLTLDANGQTSTGDNRIEQAYNSQGHNALYLDGHRPHWNTTLRVGDLASITINNFKYYGFILDSNEPGGDKSTISIDNIRIYTSATDTTSLVGDNINNLNSLGALRWAMNNPLFTGTGAFDIDKWIKLDSNQENIGRGSNGGSGMSDMILYVPETAFAGANPNDYVWFYNLNGVHYSADKYLAAQAGFEEWSAVVKVGSTPVPEGGSMLVLLGSTLLVTATLGRRYRRS